MIFLLNTLDEILKNKINGLHYGNRIVLPFSANFLKVIIESDIITDFSNSSKGINIVEHENFTDLYFLEYKNLADSISEYETVKIVLVEKNNNIFEQKNHRKINLYFQENHILKIEESDSDILFIE